MVVPTALERRPPFTLFDTAEGVGYRAVVVQPDGELAGASWSDIAQLTALRELDDGTAVDRVRLIVPVRDSAVAIAEKARELGVDGVLYKDDEDTLWNVMPEGDGRPPGVADSADSLRLPPEQSGRKKERGRRGAPGKKR